MIGNAWPVDDTGYVLAEVGEIDPATWKLVIDGYQLLDKHGKLVAEGISDLQAGRRYVADLLEKKLTAHRENVE